MHSISNPLHTSHGLAYERDYVTSSAWDPVDDNVSPYEDLDFADDGGLLSSRHCDIQEKTDRPSSTAGKIGLKINTEKNKADGHINDSPLQTIPQLISKYVFFLLHPHLLPSSPLHSVFTLLSELTCYRHLLYYYYYYYY